MSRVVQSLLIVGSIAIAASLSVPARAAGDAVAKGIVRQIQLKWENIKFTMSPGKNQTALIEVLNDEADTAVKQYPGNVDLLIWDGIVTSEHAAMASSFSALGLAKRARRILQRAYDMDPDAMDAGATTSLGVLYHRVPGFPIAYGDDTKARQLLEQAVKSAPQGLDAEYFYGDFLYDVGEYQKATEVLQQALTIPPHPDRPIWDKNRRLVIQQILNEIKSKT